MNKRSTTNTGEPVNLVPVTSSPPNLGELIESFAKFPSGFMAAGREVNEQKQRAHVVKVKPPSR
jgi:hypothetical protein